jgi:hypothetical protein
MSCHVSDASLDEEISNWQLWVAPTTTCWKTGLVCSPHWSDWLVGALVVTVQSPGPRSGTSTTSKPGPSVPENSPFIALGSGAGLTRRTVVVVTTEELSATGGVVVGAVVDVEGRCADGRRCVVVVGVVVVEVGVAEVVVTGDVEEGGRDEAAGPGVAADVSVNTNTIRRIGLDHIKRCVLFSEKCARAIVFEG